MGLCRENNLAKLLKMRYIYIMHVITRKKLNDFARRFPMAKTSLDAWYKLVKKALFKNLMEIKAVFPATDDVKGYSVFNIGGNKYRLVAKIEYRWQKVFIVAVLTHAEYDTGSWKTKITGK